MFQFFNPFETPQANSCPQRKTAFLKKLKQQAGKGIKNGDVKIPIMPKRWIYFILKKASFNLEKKFLENAFKIVIKPNSRLNVLTSR